LERVRVVAQRLDIRFECPVFVVGGTNGKGSTCAMLDSILRAAGYRVGLYTSPHLLRFNERARIDGAAVNDEVLIAEFEAVDAARGDTPLTYFEFTTLAILRLFAAARLSAAVLEIGLGGRLDAVNIIDADCAIVTSIDVDHVDYLGPTREHIGAEKAHVYRSGRPAICADPEPPQSLLEVAARMGADLRLAGRDFSYRGDRQQWSFTGRATRRSGLPYPALRGANQLLNASAVLAALETLTSALPVSQQAVRQGLLTVELPARFQVLPGRPTVVLDVAHNPHAAAVLAENLDNMGFYPVTHAVFGMLRDKDIAGVVQRLGDRIDHWHVGTLAGARGTDGAALAQIVRSSRGVQSVSAYDSIATAFAAARSAAGSDDRIIVYGSFMTVAEAMRVIAQRH
ncbi:MAG TPA: bifunctional tetrahydrofolate synthase/dihydrofolate synthase, partial [Burkholderiaceae bacterium]|nr:bifunctional tetrahydrofolate synthase/dihydrofolate synthase [Burkholderiaceae bacterium]